MVGYTCSITLSPAEPDQFAERWRSAQAQFVDDPGGATRVAESPDLT